MDQFEKRLQALMTNPNLPSEQIQAVHDLIAQRDAARGERDAAKHELEQARAAAAEVDRQIRAAPETR